MRTKLLKQIRLRYDYRFENGVWVITKKDGRAIGYARNAYKALDIMAAPFLALSELIPFYRRIWRLYQDWGTFKIYRK